MAELLRLKEKRIATYALFKMTVYFFKEEKCFIVSVFVSETKTMFLNLVYETTKMFT